MVALRKDEGVDTPFLDPVYSAFHEPRKIVMFERNLTPTGEIESHRVEKEIEPNPAYLIIDGVQIPVIFSDADPLDSNAPPTDLYIQSVSWDGYLLNMRATRE